MRVEPLIPDVTPQMQSESRSGGDFAEVLDDVSAVLGKAESAENSFANGVGDLQTAVYERARADVVLSVATAAAQRAAQALNSLLNMQV